ncbi:MAG: hypothetical protein ACE5FW_00770 [Candidatus Aenigmatarchaeota archaeon]
MKGYLALLILPALILAVSGCTLPGAGPAVTGNGVVIEAFESDFEQVYMGEPVKFSAKIRNTGSVDAGEGGRLVILGIDDWAEVSGDKEVDFGRLIAPDPERGTVGEGMSLEYEAKAPKVAQGLAMTYSPTLRLMYTYSSDIVKSLTIASQQELRAAETAGRPLPTEAVSSTQSPIALSIETKGPIRFWTDLNEVVFPLEIRITNVGGGIACEGRGTDCADSKNWNKLKIKIEGTDLTLLEECQKYTNLEEVSLWRGQSNTIVCKAKISNLPQVGPVQKMIKVHADYGYLADSTTSVVVNWRETA